MIVFGRNVAKEVIDSKKEIMKAYLSKTFDDKYIVDYLEKNNISIKRLDKKDMDYKFFFEKSTFKSS